MFKSFLILATVAVSTFGAVPEKLSLGSIGVPLVWVQLRDKDGNSNRHCFMLDTGSNITVLDRALVTRYAVSTQTKAGVTTANGNLEGVKQIKINSISFGSNEMKDVEGIEMDLSSGLGSLEDGSLDGILGMNILKRHRFLLDFAKSTVEWDSNAPSDLHVTKIQWTTDRLPTIKVNIRHKFVPLECDTGFTRVLELPETYRQVLQLSPDILNTGMRMDSSGTWVSVNRWRIEDSVMLEGKTWQLPEVGFFDNGDIGRIGMGAFQPRVWFDFPGEQVGLPLNTEGNMTVTPPKGFPLIVRWVSKNQKRLLLVQAVKPGSKYETSGIKAGDHLIKVDNLEGAQLNISSLRSHLEEGTTAQFVIERKNKKIEITVNTEHK